ncbi:MAG: DegT/DnrJ/EryC1/StrS family aminotransferase [Verrucomicrobia bacterium]|nr:DegT/DnrJ/EryC1/StrS family aminotransferase [Verrucomicrobiota bacterium]
MEFQPSARAQKRIHLSVPHQTGRELSAVKEVLDSNWISTVGPAIIELESRFSELTGLHAVAVSNGTAAMHIGVKLLDIAPGSEVVCPTLTLAATCNPLLYEGVRPVFIDSERRSWNLDPNLLEAFLKKRARANSLPSAVIVVHLFGQPAEMDEITQICRRYEVALIEDAAEALGARFRGRPAGVFGDAGIYSFNGNKIITGAGGGMLVLPSAAAADRARFLISQARDADPEGLNNYLHSSVGYNYRISTLQAAVICEQLGVLTERIQQRRRIAFEYSEMLRDIPGFDLMPQADSRLHTNWLSVFLVDQSQFLMSRSDLIKFLNAADIESRPVWRPLHKQELFSEFECVGGDVAEDLHARGICLPSSSNMTRDEREFVVSRIREAHARTGAIGAIGAM